MAYSLTVKKINKYFGSFQALKDISFTVEGGKFVTLLGPSGCGKTTLLRTIAGFLEPEDGEIYFGDRLMNDVPPNKRNTAMCFQSYALFPHKNVYENIAFGLRMRKIDKEEQQRRIAEAIDMVNLIGLEKRMPYELSGGQQQRVALARSIVVRPDILLFDEPLSNLDAKLREKVRVDIRRIQQTLGITTVYVTHDQAEALAISDVIIAMNKGSIIQMTDPRDIYDRPDSRFVADFIGSSNLCDGLILSREQDELVCDTCYGRLHVEIEKGQFEGIKKLSLCIRPEDVEVLGYAREGADTKGLKNILFGKVEHSVYMGSSRDVYLSVNGSTMRVSVPKQQYYEDGSEICLYAAPKLIHAMLTEGER